MGGCVGACVHALVIFNKLGIFSVYQHLLSDPIVMLGLNFMRHMYGS